ncbi:hypothetical protein [Nocardia fluminea]|uniref:hypothetical protein n=1 Tax=Nocardia fluminea TaxID=134984 RepID=UPI00378824F1
MNTNIRFGEPGSMIDRELTIMRQNGKDLAYRPFRLQNVYVTTDGRTEVYPNPIFEHEGQQVSFIELARILGEDLRAGYETPD